MKPWFAFALCLIAGAAGAQAGYRWIDKEGRVHYTELPPSPAEAASLEQRKPEALEAAPELPYLVKKAMADYPVTLFTAPDCGNPCRRGQEQLARRAIPYTEKSIVTPEDLTALRSARGDNLSSVPVLLVGTRALKGHRENEWDDLLDAAGYPNSKPKTSEP